MDYLGRSRALENRVFLVSANRCGSERGYDFIGGSQIVDTYGNVLAKADKKTEGIISAKINISDAQNKDIIIKKGEHEMHIFDDRNPAVYKSMCK